MPPDVKSPLVILQVSAADGGGGAERVARDLCTVYGRRGLRSWLAVGTKRTAAADVLEIPRPRTHVPWAWLCWGLYTRLAPLESRMQWVKPLREGLHTAALGWAELERTWGREDFNHPGSRHLLQLPPQQPDIVHAHNLHGGYFDLRVLRNLSRRVPVVLTLHDAWLLSGHCAHPFACERWRTGCGQCPDLTIEPPIRRDATAYNWQRKQAIYGRSRLFIATPCRWLMNMVEQSVLAVAALDKRVIPHGVDLTVFCPGDGQFARRALGLPLDAQILLFTANSIRRNQWKNYHMLRQAVEHVAMRQSKPVLFVALGEDAPAEQLGPAEIRFVPYQSDPAVVARYYRAADAYIHAARADTFPNVVLEAMACALPVVATAVGGIPEQVEDGITGFLVPPGDSGAMADRVAELLTNDDLRRRLAGEAAMTARRRFDLEQQATAYLSWYDDIIRSWNQHPAS